MSEPSTSGSGEKKKEGRRRRRRKEKYVVVSHNVDRNLKMEGEIMQIGTQKRRKGGRMLTIGRGATRIKLQVLPLSCGHGTGDGNMTGPYNLSVILSRTSVRGPIHSRSQRGIHL